MSYHAHLIEQPIPNLSIWIFWPTCCFCFLVRNNQIGQDIQETLKFVVSKLVVGFGEQYLIHYTSSFQIFKRWWSTIFIISISICLFGQSLFFPFQICKIYNFVIRRIKRVYYWLKDKNIFIKYLFASNLQEIGESDPRH